MPRPCGRSPEQPLAKDVGQKLRDALKQQLALIYERVEAKKIAKMALGEVRSLLEQEREEEMLERIRKESEIKAWERAEARLLEEGERIERKDVERAMERILREKKEREWRLETRGQRYTKGGGEETIEASRKKKLKKL